ncbi:MAG: hypothetical protein QOH63_4061 [Acidobacteriota bacterium]|jgi:hypothetical protein|nr:hypothetical protein [Acidobacteriota bacterium]
MDRRQALDEAIKSSKIVEALESHKTVTTIQHDTDLNGATIGQAWLLLRGIPNLTPALTDEITMAANAVALKLGALRYHQKRYETIQENRMREITRDESIKLAIQKGIKICEHEMLYEFEGFFHQFKSTLDMLVKVLGIIIGTNPGILSTYGKKGKKGKPGDKIITHLQGKKNDERLTPGRINWLIEEIEKASDWLASIVRTRDTISHYRPYVNFGFEWDANAGRVRVPTADQNGSIMPLHIIMREQTEALIGYSTNFIAIAVSCAIPLETRVQVMDEMEKRYIGAKWGMDLSRAIWKLASNVIRLYTENDIEEAAKLRKAHDK